MNRLVTPLRRETPAWPRAAALAATVAVLAPLSPAVAHHSYAMFDATKMVVLTGTVKEWQWTNPHTAMVLVVATGGKPTEWDLEGQSPGVLRMIGWNRAMVKPGDNVTVRINPLRSGAFGGQIMAVVGADGHVYAPPGPPPGAPGGPPGTPPGAPPGQPAAPK